jgi:UDP-glucose 4-epimerase
VSGVDAVIHLAARAHTRDIDETGLRETNYEPVTALCRALGPGRNLLFMSSIRAVAGPSASHDVTDETAPHPECAYGRWKLRAEESVQALNPQAVILRPSTIYGAGTRHNMSRLALAASSPLPLPVARLAAPRSFASVQNVCAAALFLLHAGRPGTFHVADPDVASLRDLVVWFRAARGAPGRVFPLPAALMRLRPGGAWEDVRRLACEPLVARPLRLLDAGWRPEHQSTRDGVHRWARDIGGFGPA